MSTRLGPLRSHAKLNLFLHIHGERSDGYHSVRSLLQLISLHDTITIKKSTSPGCQLTLSGHPINGPNLIQQAASLILQPGDGVRMHLQKRIPIGQGLGGGSSNAAITLLAINHLLAYQLSRQNLHDMAYRLGSDVAFFLENRNALATGRGEQLSRCVTPRQHYLLCHLPILVSTPTIFEAYRQRHRRSPHKISHQYGNDLEDVACQTYPALNHLKLLLSQHGMPQMSGSGGAFFIACSTRRQAHHLQQTLPPTLAGHKLHTYLVSGLPTIKTNQVIHAL